MVNNKPTVISTFAGGGGSSLGYHWAGYKELLAIEWEDNAVQTLKANFDFSVWQKDIAQVTAEEILEFCKIKKGELDVLDGSPPCQGFSTAGKRKVTDERNDLFKEYVRLIIGLQPKIFVMENVSGMIKGSMKGKFNEILQTLKDTGYNVKCKLMNAMWYEVPQSRERVFFIGVRKDLNIDPSYPKPLNDVITSGQALKNINNEKWEIDWVNHIQQSVIYPRICKMKMDDCYDKFSPNGSGFTLRRINKNKPCWTISKSVNHSASSDGLLHYEENRKLTISEIKRLSSFPDEYKLSGTFIQQWARIGNAVMPKMMFHIAKHLKENILNHAIQS
jgi:DNA (cytosine-5)-methyltransferase 1